MALVDLQAAIPQRARREGLGALAADLEIEAGIGFQEALVGNRATEAEVAAGPNFGRAEHALEHRHELRIEGVVHGPRQHAVERETADQKKRGDP